MPTSGTWPRHRKVISIPTIPNCYACGAAAVSLCAGFRKTCDHWFCSFHAFGTLCADCASESAGARERRSLTHRLNAVADFLKVAFFYVKESGPETLPEIDSRSEPRILLTGLVALPAFLILNLGVRL